MKHLLIITGSILLICIIITSIYSPQNPEAVSEEKQPLQESSVVSEVSTQKEQSAVKNYKVAEYEKKVAVFENGKSEPIYISDVYVSNLPPADRELLKKGIYAEDEKALKRLIEDYCS